MNISLELLIGMRCSFRASRHAAQSGERVCLKSTRGTAVSFIRCSLVHFVWTKDLIQIKTDRDRYPEPAHFSSSDDQRLHFRTLAAVSPSGSLTNRARALGLANVARKGTRGPHVLSSN